MLLKNQITRVVQTLYFLLRLSLNVSYRLIGLICLSLFFLLSQSFFNKAEAAASDCRQLGTGGTVNCFRATDNWNTGTGAVGFDNFSEAAAYATGIMCSAPGPNYVCGPRFTTGDIAGRTCTGDNCDKVIAEAPGPSNRGGYAVTYGYSTIPTNPKVYAITVRTIYHTYTCPLGFDAIYPTASNPTPLCKPANPYPSLALGAPNVSTTIGAGGGGSMGGAGTSMSSNKANKQMSCSECLGGGSQGGDPVALGSGNGFSVETDYTYNSYWPLSFTRIYNAKSFSWTHNWTYTLAYTSNATAGDMVVVSLPNGATWAYQYNITTAQWDKVNTTDTNSLAFDTSTGVFTYLLDDNSQIKFTPTAGTALSTANNWRATKLIALGGGEYTMEYAARVVSKITNPNGVEMIINSGMPNAYCNSYPVPTSVVGPGGKTITYSYDGSCRLSRVTYPDSSYKTYSTTAGQLNSVNDELGNVYNKNSYTGVAVRQGNVVSSTGLGATGAINKVAMSYNTNNTVVTDALSHSATITLSQQNEQYKPTAYSTLCTWCQGIQGSSIVYNTQGYMTSLTDYKGNITTFSYDTGRNLLTQVKEATNTAALTRQVDVVYDTMWRLPTQTTQPSGVLLGSTYNNRIINTTYDATTGKTTQKSITAPLNDGTTNTQTRTWNFDYDSLGQLTEIKNPMYVAGVYNDRVLVEYNSNGQMKKITNGLGQFVEMSDFDDYGSPQTVSYPDGTQIKMTYNARGQVLTTKKVNSGNTSDYTVSLTRNAAQLVTQITYPAGNYKKLNYDLTQRLTEIEEYDESSNYLGKAIFTLDNMSNPTKVQVLDSVGTEIRLASKQYNTKNLLWKDLTSLNYTTTYTYDNNGNLTNILDANNKNITYAYDALNRITSQTNQDNGIIATNYNPDDSIASVVDPKGLSTGYTYNGFGETIKLDSPDTGITTITRNLSGDITSKTDARGITASFTYDVLHRPTTIDYPGTTEDISITYDSCKVGKLCSTTDISGTNTYSYDSFGRVSGKIYANGAFSKSLTYGYDNYNRLNKTTYPSGIELNYSYSNGKVIGLSYKDLSSISHNIITNGAYDPLSSALKSYNYGDTANNTTYIKTFNKDGLVAALTTTIAGNPVNKSYSFDTRLNITGLSSGSGTTSSVATYDDVSRITNYNYGSGVNNTSYGYNSSFDRTSKTTSAIDTYNYSSTNHRLSSLSGGTTDSYTYDAAGNLLTESGKTYTYNNMGRMSSYNDSTNNISYLIGINGQRTKKIDNNTESNSTWYIYDESGQLVAEYDNSGVLLNEYIYLNGVPVGLLRNNNLYYIYADHLGTPRAITDTANNLQWTWENTEIFGNNLPNETISGSTFTFNLRFPGQYFDKESNLNYNYFRDYKAGLGRYIQSDPIGLAGGISTYGYVGGNSLNNTDFLGLITIDYGIASTYKGVFELIGFKIESFIKQSLDYDNNTLNLLSHARAGSMHQTSASGIAKEIIEGKFKTDYGVVNNDYFKRMVNSNKPLNINLDACQTALEGFSGTVGKNLLEAAKEINPSYNQSITVRAPNQNSYWFFGIQTFDNGLGQFITTINK